MAFRPCRKAVVGQSVHPYGLVTCDEGCFACLLAGRNIEALSAAAAATAPLSGSHEALLPSMALQIHPTCTASLCSTLLQVYPRSLPPSPRC